MRINLTSVEESKKADQIQKIIKSIFPNYTVTVIPNKYATEKGKQEVQAYQKSYYEKNKPEILAKKRERDFRKKEEKRMAIIEENIELEKEETNKDYER